jgi:hypothetical protein
VVLFLILPCFFFVLLVVELVCVEVLPLASVEFGWWSSWVGGVYAITSAASRVGCKQLFQGSLQPERGKVCGCDHISLRRWRKALAGAEIFARDAAEERGSTKAV